MDFVAQCSLIGYWVHYPILILLYWSCVSCLLVVLFIALMLVLCIDRVVYLQYCLPLVLFTDCIIVYL